MIVSTLLTILLLSVLTCAALWISISVLIALASLPAKDIFSLTLFSEIWSNMTDAWSARIAFLSVTVCALLIAPAAFEAMDDIEKEERGECTCRCRKCETSSKRVDAMFQYMMLDGKFANSFTNEVSCAVKGEN